MGIRVIGGELRGRRLFTEDLPGLRPTTDRVRESIFNILTSRIDLDDLRVLDLCAGSGALGIEALSRGASHCEFVEKSRRTAFLLKKNVAALGLGDRAQISVSDVIRAMKRLHIDERKFDLILSDPPYQAPFLNELVDHATDLLAPDGLFALEHSTKMRIVLPPALESVLERKFGNTVLSLLQHRVSTITEESEL